MQFFFYEKLKFCVTERTKTTNIFVFFGVSVIRGFLNHFELRNQRDSTSNVQYQVNYLIFFTGVLK